MASSSDLAQRFGVSEQTIRNWSNRFSTFLSPDATPPEERAPRHFTPEDEHLLFTVATLRQRAKSYAEIEELLRDGYRETPQDPTEEEPAPLSTQQLGAMVTRQQVQLASMEAERDHLEEERDEWRRRYDAEHDARIDAEKRASAAETEARLLRERPGSRDSGEDKSLREREHQARQGESATRRSWWKRLFG